MENVINKDLGEKVNPNCFKHEIKIRLMQCTDRTFNLKTLPLLVGRHSHWMLIGLWWSRWLALFIVASSGSFLCAQTNQSDGLNGLKTEWPLSVLLALLVKLAFAVYRVLWGVIVICVADRKELQRGLLISNAPCLQTTMNIRSCSQFYDKNAAMRTSSNFYLYKSISAR